MSQDKWKFHEAAKENRLDVISTISKRECNRTDEDGRTPIHWTAFWGHLDSLRMLVENGADADLQDIWGYSALHYVSSNGHTHCVIYLVNFGVSLWNINNDKQNALQLAQSANHSEIIHILKTCMDRQMKEDSKLVTKLKKKSVYEAQKRHKSCEKLLHRCKGVNEIESRNSADIGGGSISRKPNYDHEEEENKLIVCNGHVMTCLSDSTIQTQPSHSTRSSLSPSLDNLNSCVLTIRSNRGVSKKVERHKKKFKPEGIEYVMADMTSFPSPRSSIDIRISSDGNISSMQSREDIILRQSQFSLPFSIQNNRTYHKSSTSSSLVLKSIPTDLSGESSCSQHLSIPLGSRRKLMHALEQQSNHMHSNVLITTAL